MEHQVANTALGLMVLVYHRDPCRATLRTRDACLVPYLYGALS